MLRLYFVSWLFFVSWLMDPIRSLCSIPEMSLEDCKSDGSFRNFFFFQKNVLYQMSVNLLRDTDKSRYFAITEFNIIVLSFDHRVCYLMSKLICHFHAIAIAGRRKAWFHLRMSVVSFAAKRLSQTQTL